MKTNKKPLITIGVPVYNGEPYLTRCLDSLMKQTYTNLEFLITNNGSTDNSKKIIESYCKKDKRFQMLDRIKQGAGPARTEQCRLAKGEYICFCDADDYLSETFVEDMLEANDSYDLIVCDWFKFYPNGKKEIRSISLEKKNLNRKDIINLQRRIFGNDSPKTPMDLDLFSSLCGKLYKPAIINSNNIEILSSQILGGADDALFNIDYLEYANSGYKVDKPLYYYFSNPKSFSHNHKIEDIDKLDLQYDEFERRAKKYNKSEVFFDALNYRIYIQLFSVYLIAINSKEDKKVQKEYIRSFIEKPRIQNALDNVTYKTFNPVFKPFFRWAKHNKFKLCWSYMNLANKYRLKQAK